MSSEKKLKVLHYSPHNENDGIAKYQEQYIAGMVGTNVQNDFFSVSPLSFRHLPHAEQEVVYKRLRSELEEYDIFHIQHEFGLFASDHFARLVEIGKAAGKKVVVSVHLSPSYAIKPVKLKGLGPRSFVKYALESRHHKRLVRWHIEPFKRADLLLVHNDVTAQALEAVGVDKKRIEKFIHPVYEFPEPKKSSFLKDKLKVSDKDILFCTVGMLHRYKGVLEAIRALKFLPNNYKLAVIGGMHPLSNEVAIYNKACNLIDQLGLQERVYITGFVKDDNEMNSLIRECDVCVFPYDGSYYGNLSSGSINLAFANEMPVIAYPTTSFAELAKQSDGAVVLCDTYAYYELARELQRIDIPTQRKASKAYADKMAWSKAAHALVKLYETLA